MNIIKKYTGRTLWLAGLMLTTLLTGCGGGSGSSGSSTLSSTSTNDNAASWLVVETAPIDNASAVALNSKVVVTFSEAMDAASFTDASFTVIGKNETALVGTVSYNVDSKTASFEPNRVFTDSTLYTATLTTTVKSVAGQTEASNYIWSFTTGAVVDNTAPAVISTTPSSDAADLPVTGVIRNRSVTARFSEAIDPNTVKASTFTLKDNLGNPVPGTVSYSNKVATFNPVDNLGDTIEYTARLTAGITDIANPGNVLVAKTWVFTTGSTVAQGPAPVNLSTAGDFVILTKTGITNVPTSAITGDIGASPITAAAMDTVSCTEMTGIIYGADAAYPGQSYCFKGTAPDNTLVANAVLDMGIAYTDAAGRTTPDHTELGAGDISGLTLYPGLYKWGTSVLINTDVTLDGGPNDVWIFQIAGDVIQASATHVTLTGGALAKNVFWQVGGGAGVSIDTDADFKGVVLAAKAVAVKTGATVNGRLLSQTAVTLQKNTVKEPVS